MVVTWKKMKVKLKWKAESKDESEDEEDEDDEDTTPVAISEPFHYNQCVVCLSKNQNFYS